MPPHYRILVCDDHPDVAEVIGTVLGLLGHSAVVATRGVDAVALASTTPLDLGIIDIGLPDLSGYEVVRRIRKQPNGRSLFLTAISGWGEPEDRVQAIAAGFDHHVLKPIDAAILKRILVLAERARSTAAVTR